MKTYKQAQDSILEKHRDSVVLLTEAQEVSDL